jgi:uncharacterized membrane protein YfcA
MSPSIHTFLNPLETTWTVWLLTLLSAFLVGLSKSGLKGIGMIAIPMLVYLYGAKASVGILLPILIFGDLMALYYYHRNVHFKLIIRLIPFAITGILVAVLTGHWINDSQFQVTIAFALLACIGILLYNEWRGKGEVVHNRWLSGGLGMAGGFATMIGNAAGPIFNLYLLSMKLPKNSFIGTGAWFFLFLNLFKVPFHIGVWKTINWTTFHMDVLMIPGILAGTFLGQYIVRFIPEKGYRIFVYSVITLSAFLLFFK